jgi:hypothetical protein
MGSFVRTPDARIGLCWRLFRFERSGSSFAEEAIPADGFFASRTAQVLSVTQIRTKVGTFAQRNFWNGRVRPPPGAPDLERSRLAPNAGTVSLKRAASRPAASDGLQVPAMKQPGLQHRGRERECHKQQHGRGRDKGEE